MDSEGKEDCSSHGQPGNREGGREGGKKRGGGDHDYFAETKAGEED